MVVRGIRKQFNDDIEAQKASIAKAKLQRQAELDRQRLRNSVAWYHAASGRWLEVEVDDSYYVKKVLFNSYPEIQTRHIGGWSIKQKETGECYRVESGFIADGLLHAVWVTGGSGKFENDRIRTYFDQGKSKIQLYQQLITNISKLPQLFWELYQIRVSIPMIQQAFKEYQDGGG